MKDVLQHLQSLSEQDLATADSTVRAEFLAFGDVFLSHSTKPEHVASIQQSGLRSPSYFYFNTRSDWLRHKVEIRVRVLDVVDDMYIDPEQLLEYFAWSVRPISYTNIVREVDSRVIHWCALDYCKNEGMSLRNFINGNWIVVTTSIPPEKLSIDENP